MVVEDEDDEVGGGGRVVVDGMIGVDVDRFLSELRGGGGGPVGEREPEARRGGGGPDDL